MTREALILSMGKISTKRLQRRLARIARDLETETRPEELEKLRDERDAVLWVLKDRQQ